MRRDFQTSHTHHLVQVPHSNWPHPHKICISEGREIICSVIILKSHTCGGVEVWGCGGGGMGVGDPHWQPDLGILSGNPHPSPLSQSFLSLSNTFIHINTYLKHPSNWVLFLSLMGDLGVVVKTGLKREVKETQATPASICYRPGSLEACSILRTLEPTTSLPVLWLRMLSPCQLDRPICQSGPRLAHEVLSSPGSSLRPVSSISISLLSERRPAYST